MATNETTTIDAPVGWFEIGTDDPAEARSFYGTLFDWSFMEEGPYTIITTGKDHPLQGGIRDTSGPQPSGTPTSYAIPCVQVADVATVCAQIEELGGKVIVPATTLPTGLVYAHVSDPAGNQFGLFAPPPA